MGFRGPNLRNCGRKCKKRRRKCDTGRTALANLPEEGGDVAGKASVRGPGKEARAAQGGAGEARGGAREARGGVGGAGRCREGAEGVGGVWVREGAGRCRGSAGRRGECGAAWGVRGGVGSAGRCRGSALPHAAQAAGDGGSRTVPVRPEKEAVGDTYPLLRAVP